MVQEHSIGAMGVDEMLDMRPNSAIEYFRNSSRADFILNCKRLDNSVSSLSLSLSPDFGYAGFIENSASMSGAAGMDFAQNPKRMPIVFRASHVFKIVKAIASLRTHLMVHLVAFWWKTEKRSSNKDMNESMANSFWRCRKIDSHILSAWIGLQNSICGSVSYSSKVTDFVISKVAQYRTPFFGGRISVGHVRSSSERLFQGPQLAFARFCGSNYYITAPSSNR